MRDDIVLGCVLVVALSGVGTFFTMIWLAVKLRLVSEGIINSGRHAQEAADIIQCAVLDALAGIQEDVIAARIQSELIARGISVGNELGFQNAEAAARIEDAAAHVAHDLADSIGRADAQPKDGDYGRAADAALRSAEDETECE